MPVYFMPENSGRSVARAPASISSDSTADSTPPTTQAEGSVSGLRSAGTAKRFALGLKTNARWLKQFLHGKK